MKTRLLLSALALSVALAGCDYRGGHDKKDRHGKVDTAAAAKEVAQTEADMLAAWKAKDAAKLAAFYAEDAVVAMPGVAPAKGEAAIRTMAGDDLKDPAFALDFANEKTDVAASGDLAYTRGTFRVTFTDPQTSKPQNVAGNYVTVFRKQGDGSWKVIEDVATPGVTTPSIPIPPPAPAG